jgi:hypothetical protein
VSPVNRIEGAAKDCDVHETMIIPGIRCQFAALE